MYNQVHNWTFEKEVAKTRSLKMNRDKPEDPNFDGHQPFPEDIEGDIWPSLDKGRTLDSMEEAQALVHALDESGLSIPVFPPAVWAVSEFLVNVFLAAK